MTDFTLMYEVMMSEHWLGVAVLIPLVVGGVLMYTIYSFASPYLGKMGTHLPGVTKLYVGFLAVILVTFLTFRGGFYQSLGESYSGDRATSKLSNSLLGHAKEFKELSCQANYQMAVNHLLLGEFEQVTTLIEGNSKIKNKCTEDFARLKRNMNSNPHAQAVQKYLSSESFRQFKLNGVVKARFVVESVGANEARKERVVRGKLEESFVSKIADDQKDSNSPIQMELELKDAGLLAKLTNDVSLTKCTLFGKAIGDMASARLIVQGEKLLCTSEKANKELSIKARVLDADEYYGLKGELIVIGEKESTNPVFEERAGDVAEVKYRKVMLKNAGRMKAGIFVEKGREFTLTIGEF